MATYEPPIENLPIFDPSVFIVENVPLTYNEALGSFLAYPVAQGTEDLSIINVNGLATFNANEIHNQIATFNNQIIINDVSNINTNLNGENIIVNDISNNKYCNIESDKITLFSPTTTNTLTTDSWSGNIASVNTSANLTHYLGFFDSSGSGSGKIQKNVNLSCNPSTSTISATNFIGSISNAMNAMAVSLTSDDTLGNYYIPFTKTSTATNNSLYIDNTSSALFYNPNTSTLNASIFSGSSNSVAITDDNSATIYYPTFVSGSGAQSLRADITGSPLQYEPSPGRMTVSSLRCDFYGPSSSVSMMSFGTGLTTGSITFTSNQTSGSINIGSTTCTTGLCNIRPPLVCLRQIQTTNSTTYPPNVATHLGYTVQTLGSAFTTTALLSSTNTNLMSYTFTSSEYGTYQFSAIVAIAPTDNTLSRQLILAINQTSATVINTPFRDLQYTIATVGAGYLQVSGVYQIYSGSPTVYLVGYCLGSAANVTTTFQTSHFSYTRIA